MPGGTAVTPLGPRASADHVVAQRGRAVDQQRVHAGAAGHQPASTLGGGGGRGRGRGSRRGRWWWWWWWCGWRRGVAGGPNRAAGGGRRSSSGRSQTRRCARRRKRVGSRGSNSSLAAGGVGGGGGGGAREALGFALLLPDSQQKLNKSLGRLVEQLNRTLSNRCSHRKTTPDNRQSSVQKYRAGRQ